MAPRMPGEPGLPGWTIDLLDAAGAIVATTVTDANGDYSFADVGPGTYTVAGGAASRLDPDRSRPLREPTRSRRPAARTRAAWSSATSSS